jgi:hypothetical protein
MEALSTSAALFAPLPRETNDAYNLLLGKYKDGLIPDTAVNGILAELKAIRAAAPEVVKVHDIGAFDLRELIVSARSLLPALISSQQWKTELRRMIANPLSTGIQKFDELNRKYGAIRMDYSFDRGPNTWLIIHFRKPLDMGSVAEIYHKQFGPSVQPNQIMGDGNHIQHSKRWRTTPLRFHDWRWRLSIRLYRGSLPSLQLVF